MTYLIKHGNNFNPNGIFVDGIIEKKVRKKVDYLKINLSDVVSEVKIAKNIDTEGIFEDEVLIISNSNNTNNNKNKSNNDNYNNKNHDKNNNKSNRNNNNDDDKKKIENENQIIKNKLKDLEKKFNDERNVLLSAIVDSEDSVKKMKEDHENELERLKNKFHKAQDTICTKNNQMMKDEKESSKKFTALKIEKDSLHASYIKSKKAQADMTQKLNDLKQEHSSFTTTLGQQLLMLRRLFIIKQIFFIFFTVY